MCIRDSIGYDSKWLDQSRHRLKKLIQNANDSIVISHSADVSSYKKRNYYMVDHAEYLIGVFDNQKKLRSGTAQTVNYASVSYTHLTFGISLSAGGCVPLF